MSELTIKLIIILIPGVISTLVFGKLILHKEWSSFRFTLYSILFGVISYLLIQLIINLLNLISIIDIDDLTIWENLNDATSIPYREVIWASIISIIIALIAAKIENNKLIHRIADHFGISGKYGDENLYSMFLNSKEVEFIYLRDIKNQLTYHGWVKSFSENENISEIRLCDVAVYNYGDSQLLYEIGEVYLSLKKEEIIIELAKLKEDE
ncbi:hypothetical protein [Christiangramia echinicola]|uniref:Uncharacterized protein n=1 Tax=Christiangramia echinicola TaxID=279359 RepID=A0A1H1LBG2_9FLAO|nr:hypothetical protein [Christiangramia echinicola]SDR71209.1 hypothetical protein SAMN04488552_0648 [Christiangramia echinicola]